MVTTKCVVFFFAINELRYFCALTLDYRGNAVFGFRSVYAAGYWLQALL
jgi:hypothetical protein